MLQETHIHLSRTFLRFFIFTLAICYVLSGALVVHANPTVPSGWVEVRCSPVPADFQDTATVVLSNTETGEVYTITCYKVNDYIGRLQLPAGKYQVEQTTTADNFKYEALTSTISFDITADMPAAQLITLEIIKHDAVYTVPEQTPVSDPDTDTKEGPQPSQPSGETPDTPDSDTDADTNETNNAVLDLIEKESRPALQVQDSTTPEEPSAARSFVTGVSRGILVVLGSGLFVAFVFGMVYLIRQHSED